jgi:hypothetical protein
MEVAGEATDWPATLVQVPINRIDMLVIDWDLLPSPPGTALDKLRMACPTALVVVLISYLTAFNKPRFLLVLMLLSAKVSCLNVWQSVCAM